MVDVNEEAQAALIEELEELCGEYEGELADWQIEDALVALKKQYQ